MKWVEFYEEKQGRPGSKVAQDMDSRLPSVNYSQIEAIVLQVMEDELVEDLKEAVSLLEKQNVLLWVVILHLASMSDAVVELEDGEDK